MVEVLTRRVTGRGTWPGSIILRSGWSKAHARPLNEDLPDASLRLERGNASFLRGCADWLFQRGATGVMSVPLHRSNRRAWEEAGFRLHRELALMERDLGLPIEDPSHQVRAGKASEWPEAAQIDAAAFAVEWRIGALGLADAASATSRSRFLVVEHEGEVAGFAIVGLAYQTGYLQRIAVLPHLQGLGLGRSMVRASLQWARSRTARTMLLNTQTDNREATALYRSERFEVLPERLTLMRMSPPGTAPLTSSPP